MTRAVTGFAECAANAKKTMADLENELTSTLSSYAGDQATAFWQLHTQLQERMETANQEIDTMSNLVNSSFQNYGSGDAQAASGIKSLAGSVDAGGAVLGRLTGI
ncbi:MAG TPA: type VII secretion target [Pseudonocardiaceae bacterium]|nr:type VII secretion target [Pseudonocardiaceae bacterium]